MAFFSYYLIKIVPLWGLCLVGSSVAFLVPLIYISNKELIDHHVRQASDVVNQQTEQIKQVASHHAAVAAETTKQIASDYTAKAQEMVGAKTGRASSPTSTTKPLKTETKDAAAPTYDSAAFPAAPKGEFTTTAPSVSTTASPPAGEKEPMALS
jgi:uncharacterized membrane-anchored protein YhcB (DUF1043 family)